MPLQAQAIECLLDIIGKLSSNRSMRVFIGTILILLALAVAAAAYFDAGFWLKSPQERLTIIWERDINNLKTAKKLPKVFNNISKIQVNSPDARVAEWVDDIKIPIKPTDKGRYLMQIMIVQWIEGNKYGVVVQYDVFDIPTENKVFELGRTFHVGYIW